MKKILLIICNILVLFLLFGCFSNIQKEEYKHAENAKKEAIPIIHDHFKSKYGIEVQISNIIANYSGCSHDSDRCYTGLILASVRYNDTIFYVHVQNQTVYDNYQAKEIEQACLTYVLEKLDLPQPVFYRLTPNYRVYSFPDFEDLLLNDYFDGTNTEKIFNMVSPDFNLIFESDTVFDSSFPERLTALFENTTDDEQSMEFIIFKKGSADKVSSIRWYGDTAEHYAPYVEYSAIYRKNEDIEPKIDQYLTEPLSNDLPILKEFQVLGYENEPNDFVIQQEEPPKGWDFGRKFEQITPSYQFQWNEGEIKQVFIPPLVWRELCEKYDEVHLAIYKEYASGEVEYMKLAMDPDYTGYSSVALHGEFFSFSIGTSADYITFIGIRK